MQSYWKIPRRALGIEVVLSKCKGGGGGWEWIILSVWIAHILFLFCKEPAKKHLRCMHPHKWASSLPHTSQYAFSWTTPPPLRVYILYGWSLIKLDEVFIYFCLELFEVTLQNFNLDIKISGFTRCWQPQ